ncbi:MULTISPECIES: glycosyltransferase [unclassified Lentimicrobium]|uniref:glycosyltransferase n=1 Tax=unclassified Lentimicrobium TaxID=2677434 RepID=UPI0015517223|nr:MULTISPECIES: glycosyltransferase [unclassified Lentimicrobium]NPD45347.1 glycosyltransferase [Lentimicrobium sp. S6]NPD84354.1 glycosyltransferase [Lentimicrobium sp. L6]
MKIICLGNYPPRQCGIATFTENLIQSILKSAEIKNEILDVEIIAINDTIQEYPYPAFVVKTISEQKKEDYVEAANYINHSSVDICLVQHEYGIYGGESGLFLLALLRRLKVPIYTTCHTVLQKPTFHQKEVLQRVAAYSQKLVVMNQLAIGFLKNSFQIQPKKIVRIQHGVPDFSSLTPSELSKPKDWKNRKVILTFGLIGRSKGIDMVLKALPKVIKKNPEVLYVVLGKTHPNIIKHAGEEYREYLMDMVHELKIENHVIFINKYVKENELKNYLAAADIYVTPYQNKAQITSGTLSYAVASGCAVISTPYWHAEELLADNRGRLFDFNDTIELSNIILELVENPEKLYQLKSKAFEYGKTMTWPIIGDSYLSLFHQAIKEEQLSKKDIFQTIPVPQFNLSHVYRLTDRIGILQHARTSIPYFKTGYCLDDNSRALVLSLYVWNKTKDRKLLELMDVYLSYISFMQQEDGSFNNFLDFQRTSFVDGVSDDALGRTFWALAFLINLAPTDSMYAFGLDMLNRFENQIQDLSYARGYANVILGLEQLIKRFPDQEKYRIMLKDVADRLCYKYTYTRKEDWNWFEDTITYDNGLMPASLYVAYQITQDNKYLQIAEESRLFLESKCFREDWLSLIGNVRWLRKGDDFALFGQQPVDAMAMVIMYEKAYQVTNDSVMIDKLLISFYWFLGYNDLNISLIDSESNGCHDGIEEFSINRNQGAESMISYLISYFFAEPYFNDPIN